MILLDIGQLLHLGLAYSDNQEGGNFHLKVNFLHHKTGGIMKKIACFLMGFANLWLFYSGHRWVLTSTHEVKDEGSGELWGSYYRWRDYKCDRCGKVIVVHDYTV
jgi:hypothetical protein